jgi:hypothetical protein
MAEQSDKPAILSPKTTQILAFVQGFLPLMIAVCGGVGVYTRNSINKMKRVHSPQLKQKNARKPFLDRQFSLYQEIVETTGILVGLEPYRKIGLRNTTGCDCWR